MLSNTFFYTSFILFFFLSSTAQQAAAWCLEDDDCLNDGYCKSNLDFTEHPEAAAGNCVCASGFWGEICDRTCHIKCQNGGQCRLNKDEHGGVDQDFVCDCPAGFSGSLCSTKAGGGDPDEHATKAPSQETFLPSSETSTESMSSVAVVFISVMVIVVLGAAVAGVLLVSRRVSSEKDDDTGDHQDKTDLAVEMEVKEDGDAVSLPSIA